MRITSTVSGRFSAGHVLPGHAKCGREHGHAWFVRLTVEGGIGPTTGYLVDHEELRAALGGIIAEIDGESLGSFLPGVVPSPEGLCGYFRERLLLVFPNIVRVTVRADPEGYEATVEWPIR
jgi:6-pyruvoyltetrahydropterin/6-carboxytetrahydropterin synthase